VTARERLLLGRSFPSLPNLRAFKLLLNLFLTK
jgi:hypothetical protein